MYRTASYICLIHSKYGAAIRAEKLDELKHKTGMNPENQNYLL
jgi:CRISPR/Cas system-associated endonuclease/helicase Cas3